LPDPPELSELHAPGGSTPFEEHPATTEEPVPSAATGADAREFGNTPVEPGIIGLMLEAFGASDPGCVRRNNEDYYLVSPSLGLYVVADGMGGAQAGEHASKLAVETVKEVVERHPGAADASAVLESAFHEANRRIMEAASADRSLEGMGTTLLAALSQDGNVWISSVGDSRAYLFDRGSLSAITEDQTWVNEVGRRLGIDEETLKTHPMRHVLTMAVGVSEQLRVLSYKISPAPGAQLLLSSDGLHGVATEEDLKQVLSSGAPLKQKCTDLIAAARGRGGPDNITVVLLES
jgi:PPM family protein phosphatase